MGYTKLAAQLSESYLLILCMRAVKNILKFAKIVDRKAVGNLIDVGGEPGSYSKGLDFVLKIFLILISG